jgi:hypothetical protein
MAGAQAIITQFLDLNNGAFGVGQFHLSKLYRLFSSFFLSLGHLVPCPAVQQPARFLLLHPAPLLEEKGDSGFAMCFFFSR